MNSRTYRTRWADADVNGHLRHSAYADLCAQARIELLDEMGLHPRTFQKLGIGPILFREELKYLKEVGLNMDVRVDSYLQKARKDGSRWSILHLLYRADEALACQVVVEGAWLDLGKRKLSNLPQEYSDKLLNMPKTDDFSWETES